MSMFTVNMEAEASLGFEPVKAGTYPMRIEKHVGTGQDGQPLVGKDSGKPYWKWQLAHLTPKAQLVGLEGKPIQGNAGSVFYNTSLAQDTQGMLRALVEAALGGWRNFDPQELVGKQLNVVLKVRERKDKEGNPTGQFDNDVARIVKA